MKRSKWIETEVEQGGKVYLLPVRCRLEAKGNRVRNAVQTRDADTGKWHTKARTGSWITLKTSLISIDSLNEMAQHAADILVKSTETSLHPDWIVE